MRTTLLTSGGDIICPKKWFHIFDSRAAHKIENGILCYKARTRVISKLIISAPPHDAEAGAAPQCVPRIDQMQHMWKTVAAQIHKSQQKRSAALGKRVADI